MTKLTTIRRFALAGALLASAALAMPLKSQAAPPSPPYVYTGTFVGTTAYTAIFAGSVNPHGTATVYTFQFGTSTGYGAQTAPASAGSGTTGVKVKQTIEGLQPATTYHVRLVATNNAGTTYGQDVAFTTKSIPLKFQVAATPDPVVFGNSFSVSGVLTGTGAASRKLLLEANPFPYGGAFKEISHPAVTNALGSFSFPVANIPTTTQFHVVAVGSPSVSSTFVERVAVRVSLHLGSAGGPGFVRMYGAVEPSEVGASVSFQLLTADGTSVTVGWTKVGRATTNASRFSRNVRVPRRGLYRAVVHVDNGMQVTGSSRALLLR